MTVRARKEASDAMVYRPSAINTMSPVQLLIRTHGAAASMVPALHALSSSHGLRVADAGALDHIAAAGGRAVRLLLRTVAVIAAVALLLSTAIIYALVSFTLTRRTREIGIRAALGAAPQRIVTSVLARAFMQIGIGVVAGAVPSAVIMTFGVDASAGMGMIKGVASTLAVCAFIALVATMSCAAPLRRALRIDPIQALRAD